jgi:hypothetical protein
VAHEEYAAFEASVDDIEADAEAIVTPSEVDGILQKRGQRPKGQKPVDVIHAKPCPPIDGGNGEVQDAHEPRPA